MLKVLREVERRFADGVPELQHDEDLKVTTAAQEAAKLARRRVGDQRRRYGDCLKRLPLSPRARAPRCASGSRVCRSGSAG